MSRRVIMFQFATGRLAAVFTGVVSIVAAPVWGGDPLADGILTVGASGFEFTSINDAIDAIPGAAAMADYTIQVHDANHREGAEILTDGKNFKLSGVVGRSGEYPVLDGQDTHRILRVMSGSEVSISDLAFEDGLGNSNGGAVLLINGSTLSFNEVRFRNNAGERGGAIYVNNSNAELSCYDVDFDSNTGTIGGAVMTNLCQSATFERCAFTSNVGTDADYGDVIHNSDETNLVILKTTDVCGSNRPFSGSVSFSARLIIEESCEDPVAGDYDGDGDLDADDHAAIGVALGISGDTDGDGDVDSDDYTALRDQLGICAADIDGDGMVDATDLAYILGYWGGCSAP
jgi:predicted outer membrane repeat protein